MKRKRDLVAQRQPDPDRQLQELWLLLARREWSSLVVVPADDHGSVETLARSLAEVGKNLSDIAVSAVTVKVLGSSSARALAALANNVRGDPKRLWQGRNGIEVEVDPADEEEDTGYIDLPPGRLILGIPSVVSTPVSLAVTEAADLVVLGVQLGQTRMAAMRRSIDLIGRERIAGCVLI